MVHANNITGCSSLERDGKSSNRVTQSLTKHSKQILGAYFIPFLTVDS